MTVLRMTSPLTPALQAQDSPRPAQKLSFSVAALLSDTRNQNNNHQSTLDLSIRSRITLSPASSSKGDDADDDEAGSLVDVEELREEEPKPFRPTPNYVAGFAALGGLAGLPAAALHPALWAAVGSQAAMNASNPAAAAAAAAAAATANFFPSHFGPLVPLNG